MFFGHNNNDIWFNNRGWNEYDNLLQTKLLIDMTLHITNKVCYELINGNINCGTWESMFEIDIGIKCPL